MIEMRFVHRNDCHQFASKCHLYRGYLRVLGWMGLLIVF